MHIFKNPNFNFLRWRWQAVVLSLLVIAAGLFVILTRGIPLGVEFSGGTNLIVRFSAPVARIRFAARCRRFRMRCSGTASRRRTRC